MNKRLIPAATTAALLTLACAGAAQAAIQITFTPGVTSTVPGAITIVDFDSAPAAGVTVTGGSTGVGSNPGGGGTFGSVQSLTNAMTVQLSAVASYVGFAWGTKDGYNSVNLFNGATQVGPALLSNGVFDTQYANITGNAGEVFDRIVFSSSSCCFEFDNIAVKYAEQTGVVPLPAPLVLIGSGLVLLGGLARRRR